MCYYNETPLECWIPIEPCAYCGAAAHLGRYHADERFNEAGEQIGIGTTRFVQSECQCPQMECEVFDEDHGTRYGAGKTPCVLKWNANQHAIRHYDEAYRMNEEFDLRAACQEPRGSKTQQGRL